MDPAIAEIVSQAFYDGVLKTEAKRAAAAAAGPTIKWRAPMASSPVVIVDYPHVSSSGSSSKLERGHPRWHNPSEVSSVVDVLRLLEPPTQDASIAILAPYKAQVDRIQSRVAGLLRTDLAHLNAFSSARAMGGFVGTVDSFQGSEADIVVLSLVRNNPRTGLSALGFLRDRRRINVALSRAKSQLIIVGSLAFLREAVRGVNPDGADHNLSFLEKMATTIGDLAKHSRNNLPLVTILKPEQIRGVA
jgi:superfamily I DNA and/or RNA helicase